MAIGFRFPRTPALALKPKGYGGMLTSRMMVEKAPCNRKWSRDNSGRRFEFRGLGLIRDAELIGPSSSWVGDELRV